jgi:hypothetical protein
LIVSYDPASNTVTLVARGKVKRGQALRLTLIGSGPDGIAKVTGLPLAGDGVHAGTNYVATITGGTIKHANAATGKARGLTAAATRAVRIASKAHPAGPSALQSSRAASRKDSDRRMEPVPTFT